MRVIQSGLCLLLVLLGDASAAPPANTPEAVVLAFHTAIQKDCPAATVPRFMHPDECARFKAIFMPAIRADPAKSSVSFVGKKMSLRELEAMPPIDFMTAFYRTKDMRLDGTKFSQPKFLGSVREGDIVHLVVRTDRIQLDGSPLSKVELVSLKSFGTSWKMMMSGEFEAYARFMTTQ